MNTKSPSVDVLKQNDKRMKLSSDYKNQTQSQEQKDYFENTQRASYGLPTKQTQRRVRRREMK